MSIDRRSLPTSNLIIHRVFKSWFHLPVLLSLTILNHTYFWVQNRISATSMQLGWNIDMAYFKGVLWTFALCCARISEISFLSRWYVGDGRHFWLGATRLRKPLRCHRSTNIWFCSLIRCIFVAWTSLLHVSEDLLAYKFRLVWLCWYYNHVWCGRVIGFLESGLSALFPETDIHRGGQDSFDCFETKRYILGCHIDAFGGILRR